MTTISRAARFTSLNCPTAPARAKQPRSTCGWLRPLAIGLVAVPGWVPLALAAEPAADPFAGLAEAYAASARPLMKQFCLKCHSTAKQEGELDLERFANMGDVRRGTKTWLKVVEMLASGEMPPKEAPQLSADERKQLLAWARKYLHAEALASAGDPGPVVLRRLGNAEYTYTIRDLTGVESLNPARHFPVDGAAGEGFTNTGSALVMSPSLVTKYLDAAKEIAAHAVLLPDGFRFSKDVTPSDWTNQSLADIRDFYRQFTDSGGGDKVNLQGIVFDTNQGGRLPIEKYLRATLMERDALAGGTKSIEAVAKEHSLNAKYLGGLWKELSAGWRDEKSAPKPASLTDALRLRWRAAQPADAAAIAGEIAQWQQALWRFTSVGHIGKVGGPKAWIEPVSPLTARQELKLKMPPSPDGKEVVLYLAASDAGDGNDQDFVIWERPRLVAPGRPDLLLRDVRAVTLELATRRERIFASTAKCLAAAAEASATTDRVDAALLAQKHGVDAESLAAWLEYLGIGAGGPVKLGTPISRKQPSAANYDFIQGWVGDDALSVVANSSDQHVRIPGNMKPHSVAVHPTPTLSVAVGWRSPAATTLSISGSVEHAHPECGNGVAWSLELRRGNTRQRLAAGISQGAKAMAIGPLEKVAVQAQDVVSLVINPRDGNHSCDLTAIDLKLSDATRKWDLAGDLSPDILAGNPHNDSHGNADVWHFYSEPASGSTGHVIPAGTLLARWQAAATADEKQKLAADLQKLLLGGTGSLPKDSPDAQLAEQLASLGGPLFARGSLAARGDKPAPPDSKTPQLAATDVGTPRLGLDPALFGRHPSGGSVEPASLCVQAPSVIEVRFPADLVAGTEFVAAGMLHPQTGQEGSVQLQVLTARPESASGLRPTPAVETNANGPWTSNNRGVTHATPIIVMGGSQSRKRIEASFDEFRNWFPAALAYTKIVPVDEVVTLTLLHREDDHLQRLMLDDAQKAKLDRLWNELHFVSRDALTLVDAYLQLMEYATQDADPKVFEPLRKPIHDRAAAFRQELIDAEPKQLDALIRFAAQAYRRPLTEADATQLRGLYRQLRAQELPHDEAFRLTLARVFIAPAFLYRLETTPAGTAAAAVSDWELASRLSYFLWSSQPDSELRAVAAAGRLHEPEVLKAQARRMLADARTRRLATEFACQWLHIYDFASLDEKSEKYFPEFAELRGDMYEESILFFTDLFQRDASVLGLFNADHTFVNGRLAKFYGVPGGSDEAWRRVDGLREHGRGGILGLATTLAKQSGASRTSPILRGNWVSEVLLGEKLPKPPKDVPRLPDDETSTDGLTVRQLIEKHTSDPRCYSCHQKIDHFGFALEGFDAIGRRRNKDLAARPIDTVARLPDGAELSGLAGLRDYLLTTRREAVLRQFCRKLLGYSLGRGIQLSDEPLLAQMQERLAQNDYRFSVAVEAIVESRQFREIRGRDAQLADSP